MTNNHPDGADELIVRAAQNYNEPGPLPREEMWHRIVEARRSPAAARPIRFRSRRTQYWMWPGVGVAAAGLIAVGVAIGRHVEQSQSRDRHTNSVAVGPSLPDTAAARDSGGTVRLPVGARDVAAGPVPDSNGQGARSAALRSLAIGDATGSGGIAYRLAVVNHVVGSEAMITAFRASARRGDVDPQLAKWSRDLLGETRLLESAAPQDDATMKRLLEDLELVLAQIVQYTNRGTHSSEDLDLIERSIHRRAVMSNLRSISAGRLPSGT